MILRLIADIHGQYSEYKKIVEDANKKGIPTVQVGDFGFNYQPMEVFLAEMYETYKVRNNCILGNHDWYPARPTFDLGDYGVLDYAKTCYFVRGAFSIDWKYQLARGSWFPEEELTINECNKCLKHYEKNCKEIDVLISHEVPRSVATKISKPDILRNFGYEPDNFTTRTSELLQRILEIKAPKIWVHGHFHNHYELQVGPTKFIGLGINKYVDITI